MIRRCLAPMVLLLGGCADTLFVDAPINALIDKSEDRVAKFGSVALCHTGDTPWAEVQALAEEECGRLGWQTKFVHTQKWQCRLSAPHVSTFQCFVPGYVDKNGVLLNPSNKKAFLKWKAEQEQAQKAKSPAAPAAAGTPVPSGSAQTLPAPAERPLSPADIAGKPPVPGVPLQFTPVPVQGAYPTGGFSLNPGGWGEHFQE